MSKTSKISWFRYLNVIAIYALLVIITVPVHAARILVVGDSWGVAAGPALQAVLIDAGSTETVASIAVGGETAANINTPAWLATISTALEDNPDATHLHLSLGGNDFLGHWRASNSMEQEDQLVADILEDITAIVDHILAQRPEIRIYWSSYDFPRPLIIGNPVDVNNASLRFSVHAQTLADSMGDALSYGDFNGMTQVVYGFDGVQTSGHDPDFVIPPGDPSLPDPQYPGPAPAYFDSIHLTPEAYQVLAQKQYEHFYQSELSFQINAGLNDAWFNPVTDGQGFFITVFPDLGVLVIAWFTYDTELPDEGAMAKLGDPGHRWLTAVGPYADNQAVLDITIASGGLFDTATEIDRVTDGTLLVTFSDCNSGTVEYSIPSIDREGTVPIQRIANDNISLCDELSQE
jgi:lysophospholipase L1-like esterase